MYQYHCLNPISETGLNMFGSDYRKTDSVEDADAILVRSAKMHDMEIRIQLWPLPGPEPE